MLLEYENISTIGITLHIIDTIILEYDNIIHRVYKNDFKFKEG